MKEEDQELEQQCEDAVYQIACTRTSYSIGCANQYGKYLTLTTKRQTTKVQNSMAPKYTVPVITNEQQELFNQFEQSVDNKNSQSNIKNEIKDTSNQVKELKSIFNQIKVQSQSDMVRCIRGDIESD
ncbi:hypothetical protein TKK_0003620 [Trichogramma kaykai]